jgi:predicted DNA-binding antitoxin AbrB/MazE fold protein
MHISVAAIYEHGVLKPKDPLPLQESEEVLLQVHTGKTWAERTAGLMGWTGSAAEAEFFALDPELDFPPAPEEP